jgi:hypothetical protein
MLIIKTDVDLSNVRAGSINNVLRSILDQRRRQLASDDYALEDLARFFIVQFGDALPGIEAAAGIPIATNFVDGITYDDPDFVPSWEWVKDHDGWFELVFVLSDDGFGHVFLVPDEQGIDARLLDLCRRYAAEQHSEGSPDQ